MKIGFIGAGNMCEALVRGMLKKAFKKEDILAADIKKERLDYIKKELGIETYIDNIKLANEANIIILSVKPQQIKEVLQQLKNTYLENKLILSIAAGISLSYIKDILEKEDLKLIRAMPNICANICKAISCIYYKEGIEEEEKKKIEEIFLSVGEVLRIEREDLLDIVVAISGSGPAYVALLIEALIEGAIEYGLPYEVAKKLATKTVEGAACLIDKELYPANIKIKITSPGGVTAKALHTLERRCFKAAILDAVEAAYNKAKELKRNDG